MSASKNIDRYLKDLGIMQRHKQATAELEACKARLAAALAAQGDYMMIKRERDELRELKFDAETIAYFMVRLAMGYNVEKDNLPSSSYSPSEEVQPALARIRSLLQDRVDKQVDGILKQELDEVFSAESEEVASQVIYESFGPEPYNDVAKNRIRRIKDRCRANAYAALRGPWGVDCPNCGLRHSYAFDDEMIRILVTTSLLRVECRHRGLLMHFNYQENSNIHGVVEFTLRGVIRTYLFAA